MGPGIVPEIPKISSRHRWLTIVAVVGGARATRAPNPYFKVSQPVDRLA